MMDLTRQKQNECHLSMYTIYMYDTRHAVWFHTMHNQLIWTT